MTLFSCFQNNDYLCADEELVTHRIKIKVLRRSEVRSDLLFLQFLSIFCPIYKILELHLLVKYSHNILIYNGVMV